MNEQVLPAVEGITPSYFWIFICVCIGLLTIALMIFKAIEFAQGQKDRKQRQQVNGNTGLTDSIATEVWAKMEPKLERINEKLAADKERLDSHERRLNDQEKNLAKISRDTEQIMNVLDGMLMHFISGNDQERLKTVKSELDHYKNSR